MLGPDGSLLTLLGEPGSELGQFTTLGFGSLALDGDGNLFVVDNGNQRVQKFDAQGQPVLAFGAPGEGEGQFTRAIGISVDLVGHVYVTDNSLPYVQVFDNAGSFLFRYGGEGRGPGQFRHATGIALDSAGNIYVSDYTINASRSSTTTAHTCWNGASDRIALSRAPRRGWRWTTRGGCM